MILLLAMQLSDLSSVNGDIPPVRFMGGQVATISTDTVHECGSAPDGQQFAACFKDGVIHLPNPCGFAWRDRYALLLCHELSHSAGWTEEHEK